MRPNPRERTPCQRIRHGPRIRRRRRLATSRISGLYHTAFGLAVYASQWKSPATTQDSLPVAGPQALPDGIRTRRVPTKGLDHEHLLLSRASCATSFPLITSVQNPVSSSLICSRNKPGIAETVMIEPAPTSPSRGGENRATERKGARATTPTLSVQVRRNCRWHSEAEMAHRAAAALAVSGPTKPGYATLSVSAKMAPKP